MTDGSDDDDDVQEALDEVYQPAPEHALTPAKTFEAWHLPRKQYVRVNQWCAEVRKLIPELGLAQGDPFRYLTLPGNELLDIRALHGVCEPLGVKLRYLGFNSVGPNTPAQAELTLSQSEVRALSSIDDFSGVIEDRLEAVANNRSAASERARQAGPFHAINMDLCESIAFREIGHAKGSALEALGELLRLQLQTATPWLLFITTKAKPSLLADFARDGFNLAINANAEASEDFRAELADLITGDLDQLDSQLAAAWGQHDTRFLRLFCMGLGKWLLGNLAKVAPPRELKLLSSCFYQSGPDGPDMLSLAFRCEAPTHTLNDIYAILPTAEQPAPPSEIECALNLGVGVREMFDLDERIANDAALQTHLVRQAGRLLAQARYSEADYEAWATATFA